MSRVGREFRLWLPVVAWLGVMALFSTDVGSRSATESALGDLLHSWWPNAASWLEGVTWLDSLSLVVRKVAHFTEYGVLAFLLGRAFREGTTMPGRRALVAVVGACVLVACVDEWHQSRVATRTGSLVDVGVDVAGAVAVSMWFHLRGHPPFGRRTAAPPLEAGGAGSSAPE